MTSDGSIAITGMLAADSEASNARAARVLAAAWIVLVPLGWLGLFVAAMRPDASRAIAIDVDGYFLPRYVWASAQLARGVLPLWNPHELAGVPMLGAAQAAVLYPPRVLLFALLPPGVALHAFMVGHYLLLGVGTFLALRALGLRWPGAALGTPIVALQPFMLHGHYAPHWISNFVWMPFAVAALLRTIARPGPGPAAALAGALSMQILAGYPEYAFDTALVLALLLAFAAPGTRRAAGGPGLGPVVLWTGGAAVATVLVTAVQWVPLVEAAGESVRAAGDFEFMFGMIFDRGEFAPGPRGWVDALGLLLYLPPLAWALLAVGLVRGRLPCRAAMVALAVLAWSAPTWLRDVPPFSLFRGPLCWHSILHLPLAALAGAGLERLLAARGEPPEVVGPLRPWWILAVAIVVAVPVVSARAAAWTAFGLVGLAVALRWSLAAGMAVVLASALATILTWVPGAQGPLAHRWAAGQPTYPDIADRIEDGRVLREACGAYAEGRIVAPRETWLGVPLLAGLSTAQGYPESLAPRRTSRLLDEAGLAPHGVFPLVRERLAAAGPVLRLLDVRCMVLPPDWAGTLTALGFHLARTLADGRIVGVRAGSAAVVVSNVAVVASDAEAFAWIERADFDPTREAVIVGDGPGVRREAEPGRAASVRRPAPGRIEVAFQAPAGGLLVVPETWYPGWRASVDGRTTAVRRADYAFLGIALPPGAASVSLRYAPRGFAWAVPASVAGLLLLAVAGMAAARSRRTE